MSKKQAKNTWYPLDNAGVLYSAIQKDRYSAIYRFSAVMTEPVNPPLAPACCRKDHATVSWFCRSDAPRCFLVLL